MYYIPHNQRGGHLLIIRIRAKGERAITSAESGARALRVRARRVGTREKIQPRAQALTTSWPCLFVLCRSLRARWVALRLCVR